LLNLVVDSPLGNLVIDLLLRLEVFPFLFELVNLGLESSFVRWRDRDSGESHCWLVLELNRLVDAVRNVLDLAFNIVGLSPSTNVIFLFELCSELSYLLLSILNLCLNVVIISPLFHLTFNVLLFLE
jgi:hypothetical protein